MRGGGGMDTRVGVTIMQWIQTREKFCNVHPRGMNRSALSIALECFGNLAKETAASELNIDAYGKNKYREASPDIQQLESEAMTRLKPWGDDLTWDDLYFDDWTGQATPEELFLGTLYEYARESETVRALAWLCRPKQSQDEILQSFLHPGKKAQHSVHGIRPQDFLLKAHWWRLSQLGEALADNLPFALVRQDRALITKTLQPDGEAANSPSLPAALPQARPDEFGAPQSGPPLQLAPRKRLRSIVTCAETDLSAKIEGWAFAREFWPMAQEGDNGRWAEYGLEVFLLEINWRDYTDAELRKAFEALLALRPVDYQNRRARYNPAKDLLPVLDPALTAWRLKRLYDRLHGKGKKRSLSWPRHYWKQRARLRAQGVTPGQAFATTFPVKAEKDAVAKAKNTEAFSKAQSLFYKKFQDYFGFEAPDNVESMIRRDLP